MQSRTLCDTACQPNLLSQLHIQFLSNWPCSITVGTASQSTMAGTLQQLLSQYYQTTNCTLSKVLQSSFLKVVSCCPPQILCILLFYLFISCIPKLLVFKLCSFKMRCPFLRQHFRVRKYR